MSVEWIEHKGKKILYIRYTGLKPAEMLDQVRKATAMIVDSKSNDVLTLSDITDCYVGKDFMELMKEQGAISLPLTKKAAVVGVTGLKNVLLRASNAISPKPRVPFDTVELARDWLAE
jgi:hypothetical protein